MKTIPILNWIIWNRTVCIKMDLVLNNLQRLMCHKAQTKHVRDAEYDF